MRFILSSFIALAMLASGVVAIPAFAQTEDDYGIAATGTYCPTLFTTMVRGARDASTNGQVSELQKFLADYYNFDPVELVTGYFGRITQGYVMQFQKEQGLPSFGIAGQLTRAKIATVCNQTPTTQTSNTNSSPSQPTSNVVQSGASTSVTSCRSISAPGTYILSNDLSSTDINNACISIHDTSSVTLDCANHSITADRPLDINTLSNFTVMRCILSKPNASTASLTMRIAAGTNGTFTNNTIKGTVSTVVQSSGLQFKNNTFNTIYQQYSTSNTTLSNNTFAITLINPSATFAAVILSQWGSNNQFINNVLDGKSDGIFSHQIGADDGITINEENKDVVQKNIIKNNWDCGIETYGKITSALISDNTIQNAGICGIGAWYYSSWNGNNVQNNFVDNAPALFHFERNYGFRPQGYDTAQSRPADEHIIYFKDNSFVGNTLSNESDHGLTLSYSSFISILLPIISSGNEIQPTQADMILSNNVFKQNNFGTTYPAYFAPASMIVDGGGNICKTTGGSNYPLSCGGGAVSSTPTISSITPNTATANTAVTINGTNLTGASEIDFYNASNNQWQGSITNSVQNNITVSSDGTSLQFTLSGAFAYNVTSALQVRVVTPNGSSNALTFTITAPAANAPSISSISPSSGSANSTLQIYGSNLSGVTSVSFYSSNGQLAATFVSPSIQSTSANSVFLNIGGPFAFNTSAGTYQVRVVSSTGTSNALNFTLTPPSTSAPTITSISPTTGTANTAVTVTGSNLSGASSVLFYTTAGVFAGSLIPFSSAATSVTFIISGSFAYNETAGNYQVSIVTPTGTSNPLTFNLTTPQ